MTVRVTPMTVHLVPVLGSPEEMRERVSMLLWMASMYAMHGAELAEAGDDLGLQTNTIKLIAAVKAARDAVKEITRHE
jgi:hypothetical protein